eukprot:CAMPEP_0169168188 /NCGR_PEP_ID=MMETSP1015-20121227/60869_1 /TAXON_ID=342587 /ORGANISM="Karlodinium micrum, Strain CCMP2283" /LENGTH=37 /DNA_ID= /DNA_START= /DNA_END= /DNA_ORIENTATION=
MSNMRNPVADKDSNRVEPGMQIFHAATQSKTNSARRT